MREVGDSGLGDLPDLLVWGGVGTRMDANIETILDKWAAVLFRGRDARAAGEATEQM